MVAQPGHGGLIVSSPAGWERLFWTLFRLSTNPVALIDTERRFVEVNDPLVELFGRTRDQLIGSDVPYVVSPSERSSSARRWEAFLLGGASSGTGHLVRGDGSEVACDFAARLVVLDGRELAVYVFSTRSTPRPPPTAEGSPAKSLTKREREVVTLIALGRDTDGIAEDLSISPETVRSHVRNAMAKLNAHTRAQLVANVVTSDKSR